MGINYIIVSLEATCDSFNGGRVGTADEDRTNEGTVVMLVSPKGLSEEKNDPAKVAVMS